MKKEKSVKSVVMTHILTTSIVIPFFGVIAAYFINKYLSEQYSTSVLMLLRDTVYIIFFFMGVKYSLSYINKKIIVLNPQKSSKYSIIVFSIIMSLMFSINVFAQLNAMSIIYNALFFGIIFAIFVIFTNKYFKTLPTHTAQEN